MMPDGVSLAFYGGAKIDMRNVKAIQLARNGFTITDAPIQHGKVRTLLLVASNAAAQSGAMTTVAPRRLQIVGCKLRSCHDDELQST